MLRDWLWAPVAVGAAVALEWLGGPFVLCAVLIVLVGARCRWPARVASLSPATRGIVLLAIVVVLHVGWFRYGWTAFRPLCVDGTRELSGHVELIGPMSVEAADSFYDFFHGFLGSEGVRRDGAHGILIRPAWRMIPTEYLWNITSQSTHRSLQQSGEADDACIVAERALMKGGHAAYRSAGWGYWPYNTIDELGDIGRWLVRYHRRLEDTP